MNKKILALFLTFILPNYSWISDIDKEIQKLEEKIKENEEKSKSNENITYLVLLREEKENLLQFRQRLEEFMQNPKSIVYISYKPKIYCDICINVTRENIQNALLNGSIDDMFKKIDDAIKTIDETINTLDKAYTEFKRCILRKNDIPTCKNNFNSETTTFSIKGDKKEKIINEFTGEKKTTTVIAHVNQFKNAYPLNNEKLRKRIAILRAKKAYTAQQEAVKAN